ncbi:MAG: ABC transporter ATP-binding protein [Alphaproteobacteria bacterium]|nr:ABC transporter ATP-binding protein [Alphaproteobacteria bacterium]
MSNTILDISGLRTQFGASVIHDNLVLKVQPGEIMGIVGGSGTGKSVLLRTILGLNKPAAGKIKMFGEDITDCPDEERRKVLRRMGVLFQDGALFSSMTVAQNIEVPLAEHTDISPELRAEISDVKINLVGLPLDAANKYPSELSGGMRKRAGLARALALDPEILFLDEPTAGLDPIGAARFDELIRELRDALGLTVMMVTHDLDSLNAICDRIAVLLDKRIKVGTMQELMADDHPWLHDYFHGPRARAAQDTVAGTENT